VRIESGRQQVRQPVAKAEKPECSNRSAPRAPIPVFPKFSPGKFDPVGLANHFQRTTLPFFLSRTP
jgi:hypothetical protein